MNPQGQAQGAPGQPMQMRLLRPEQLASLPVLTPQEKQKYEEGLRKLWQSIKDNPPDSQNHIQAKNKITEFSRMVYQKITALQMRQQQAQQQQQGGAAPGQMSPTGQQQQMNQGAGSVGQAQQLSAQQQAMLRQQQQQQQLQQQVAQQQAHQQAAARAQQAAPPGNAQNAAAQAAAGPARPAQIPQTILDHTNALPWSAYPVPPQVQTTPEARLTWLRNMKQKYASNLWNMESLKSKIIQIDTVVKEKQGSLSAEEVKKLAENREAHQRSYGESQKLVNHVRAQLAQVTGQNQQGRPQQGMPGQNTGANQSMQAASASVNAAMNAARNQQLAAGQQPQAPGQAQVSQTQGTPATPATAGPVQQQGQQPQQQQPQQPQQQQQATAQVAVKQEPGMQQPPQPPPVNTAVAAAGQNMPSAGTPTQGAANMNRVQTPQTQTPATAGPVRPLSHAAAVNRANSSTNVTGQPINGTNGTTTPGSAGAMNGVQQTGHPHAHPQPTAASMNAKMPISKNLPEKSTNIPTPVAIGGGVANGRPTYGAGSGVGGGVMNQPVIAKNNAGYNFDADGDHVLSKKKLDELVRQVVGGGTSADAAYLTPDVEESVLHVADAFVDNVINEACQMAKQRGSKVLEMRDLQLVIERVYNLRIPGYTSDELRTVRKAQPSAQYYSKLSAVQAAKIMPTNRDEN